MTRHTKLVACVLLTLITICFGCSDERSASDTVVSKVEIPGNYYGTNYDFLYSNTGDWEEVVKSMAGANTESVRVPLRWNVVEPVRGQWRFDAFDRIVDLCEQYNIEVLATLMGIPSWANNRYSGRDEGFPDVYPPKDLADWEEFVRQAVARYKNRIKHWEIWNEPNGIDFYRPMPDAEEYVEILKISYQTIKEMDPEARIIMGGLQFNGIIANLWSDVKIENFIQGIYQAGGKDYFDAVNIHPYVTVEQGTTYLKKLLDDLLEVMKVYQDEDKPIWITEYGFGVEEPIQAHYMSLSFDVFRTYQNIERVYWFTFRDYKQSVFGGESMMGIVTYDLEPKESYNVFRELAQRE